MAGFAAALLCRCSLSHRCVTCGLHMLGNEHLCNTGRSRATQNCAAAAERVTHSVPCPGHSFPMLSPQHLAPLLLLLPAAAARWMAQRQLLLLLLAKAARRQHWLSQKVLPLGWLLLAVQQLLLVVGVLLLAWAAAASTTFHVSAKVMQLQCIRSMCAHAVQQRPDHCPSRGLPSTTHPVLWCVQAQHRHTCSTQSCLLRNSF
mgnify:CR=1 FL=1